MMGAGIGVEEFGTLLGLFDPTPDDLVPGTDALSLIIQELLN